MFCSEIAHTTFKQFEDFESKHVVGFEAKSSFYLLTNSAAYRREPAHSRVQWRLKLKIRTRPTLARAVALERLPRAFSRAVVLKLGLRTPSPVLWRLKLA